MDRIPRLAQIRRGAPRVLVIALVLDVITIAVLAGWFAT